MSVVCSRLTNFWVASRSRVVEGIEPTPRGSEPPPGEWRQGDVFDLSALVVVGRDGVAMPVSAEGGVAVISQTCDVVLGNRTYVQVAPVVSLDGAAASAAAAGKRSRFAHLPQLDNVFVDLDQIATVTKSALIGLWRAHGVGSDYEVRRLGAAIARRFGRFAFPDEVSESMKALQDLVQSKAPREQSPFGSLLGQVLELRAESPDWSGRELSVTISIVTRPGVLPPFDEDGPGPISERVARLRPTATDARAALTNLAVEIGRADPDRSSDDRHWLWQFVAEAAALMCQAEAERLSVGWPADARVPSFEGESVDAEEYSLARVRRSEVVDLDHLSEPHPFVRSSG